MAISLFLNCLEAFKFSDLSLASVALSASFLVKYSVACLLKLSTS